MGLTPEQLHAMTLHHFAHIMTPPTLSHHDTLPLLTRPVPAMLRNDQARYCPRCLSEAAYHRLHWSHPLVTACSQHQSLLLDHCYHCQRSVSVWDVTQALCSACGSRLSEGQEVDLSLDSPGLRAQQHLFTGLLDAPESLLPDDTVPLAAWEAYDLVAHLCGLLSRRSVGAFHHRMPRLKLKPDHPCFKLLQQHGRVATAFKALFQWPTAFHSFIDGYRRIPSWNGDEIGGLTDDLGPLYRLLQGRWSALAPVQMAFADYFVTHYARSFHVRKSSWYKQRVMLRDRMPYWSYVEAAAYLRLEPEALTILAETHRLERVRSSDSAHWLFTRVSVDALDKRWSKCLSLQSLVTHFGLTPSLAHALFGTLDPDNLAHGQINERYPFVLLLRLQAIAQATQQPTGPLIPLTALLAHMVETRRDLSHLLTGLWKGKVLLYRHLPDDTPLHLGGFSCRAEKNAFYSLDIDPVTGDTE